MDFGPKKFHEIDFMSFLCLELFLIFLPHCAIQEVDILRWAKIVPLIVIFLAGYYIELLSISISSRIGS